MRRELLISLALVILGGAVGNWFRFAGASPDRGAEFEAIPLALPDYQGREEFFDENTYAVLNATASTLKRYTGVNGFRGDLFIAYIESQRFGTGIHSPLVCLPGGGWKIESEGAYSVALSGERQVVVNRLVIGLGSRLSIMYYWYESRRGIVASEYGLKADLFRSALSLHPTDAALVRITVPVNGRDVQTADQHALQFVRALDPYVRQALPF